MNAQAKDAPVVTGLPVYEIFRSLQGEGVHVGEPMTFVRLWGCNMVPKCAFCDTPQVSQGQTSKDASYMTPHEITQQCLDRWVCITGGEPTIHPGLDPLVLALKQHMHSVSIETNGTNLLLPNIARGYVWVCVSPKHVWPRASVLERADEVKLLVSVSWEKYDLYHPARMLATLNDWAYTCDGQTISIQPIWDDEYGDNLQWSIELAQRHQVRLSVQLHKILGLK